VLVALAVIGVVASMTIPALIKAYEDKINKTKFLVTHKILREGNQRLIAEHGNLSGLYQNYRPDYLQDLANHVNFVKLCSDRVDYGLEELSSCQKRQTYKALNLDLTPPFFNPWDDPDFTAGVLYNGAVIFIMKWNHRSQTIWIDVNGNKSPNQWGKDMFTYWTDIFTNEIFKSGNGCDRLSTGEPGKGQTCSFSILQNIDY